MTAARARPTDCPTGKRRYRDRIGAKYALAVLKESASWRRQETRAYHCRACNGWHLTSKP
ncbi:hypothetical protein [Streptomyces sp.]|uniref:hypothetical protein n=1 Tax=Streptomyces sp. TaxID=1931 RepID=UPI0028126F46|nr:hypothetical protein [Streptomyces sp.]